MADVTDMVEKIGYLIAKMEEIGTDQKALAVKVDSLEARVNEKFTTVETALKVLKYLGIFIVAVATLKFGDLPALWSKVFG